MVCARDAEAAPSLGDILYWALHQSNWSTRTELTPAFFGREAQIFIWITAVQFRHLKAVSWGGWHGPCHKEVNLGQSTLILTPAFSFPCSLTPGCFQRTWICAVSELWNAQLVSYCLPTPAKGMNLSGTPECRVFSKYQMTHTNRLSLSQNYINR